MTLSTDAGSTWVAGATYRSVVRGTDDSLPAAGVGIAVAGGAQMVVVGSAIATESLSNAGGERACTDIYCYRVNTGTSTVPYFMWNSTYITANGELCFQTGGGANTTAGDYDAIRFTLEGGGNFDTTGRYSIFAIPIA
jgi:hypothetical protein